MNADDNPIPPSPNGDDEVREFYARARREPTEEDLQAYMQIDDAVPLAGLIEELEEIQRQETAARKQG